MTELYQQLQKVGMQQQPQQQKKLNPSQSFQNNNNFLKAALNSSNPSELVQKMVSQNPKLQSILSAYQSSGMTPKQFFYHYANSQGIDPNQFLSSLSQ